MKKLTLLFSSFAVVASAFAVAPVKNENLPALNVSKAEAVQYVATTCKGEKKLVKSEVSKKVAQKAPGFAACYSEPSTLFTLGLSEGLNGFGGKFAMRKSAAYVPHTWVNTSVGATDFEWEYTVFNNGQAEFAYSSEKDLVNSESYSNISAPTLYAVSATGDEDSYQIDPDLVGYYYGGDTNWQFSSGEQNLGLGTYMHANDEFSTFQGLMYNPSQQSFNPTTGLDAVFTDPDPDGYGFTNPVFVGYANFFHAPASPYFMSKLWGWVNIQAKKNTVVEMTLFKVDEEGNITDDVLAKGSTNVSATTSAQSRMLSFDLYCIDEDGLETDELVVIDCAFIAVMNFNKDDIAQVNVVGPTGAQYSSGENNPYQRNAYIVLNVDGEQIYLNSPYSYYTDETYSTLMAITDFVWQVDATFPWIFEVNDETSKEAPVAGGDVQFTLSCLYNVSSLGVVVPEDATWIDMSKATVAVGEDGNQVVTFPVDALPADMKGREATLSIEGPAINLDLTITQGEVAAVDAIVTEGEATYYDLAGRKVANPEKGVYVKVNGNKAEKVVL